MNKYNSIFRLILQIFSKHDFYEAVKQTKADRCIKGFSCWGQFVAMLLCQLAKAQSLREITGGLATCMGN